jgi:hypothetical protein
MANTLQLSSGSRHLIVILEFSKLCQFIDSSGLPLDLNVSFHRSAANSKANPDLIVILTRARLKAGSRSNDNGTFNFSWLPRLLQLLLLLLLQLQVHMLPEKIRLQL